MTNKTRLVMKRLRDVKRGDIMVGRAFWTTLGAMRRVVSVHQSTSRPGKLCLTYALNDRFGHWDGTGKSYRWPDFYVICLKQV